MLGTLRKYLFEKEKKKRIRESVSRRARFIKDRANHYGLLVDAAQTDHRLIATHFAEELRKKGNRVNILGFLEKKQESIAVPFEIFTTTDLDKLSHIPKSEVVENFIRQPFDVLINMSIHHNHKALEYICAVSHAHFRIGPWYHELQHNPYDLCLDAGASATLTEWISELMHTLEKIY